MTLKQKYELALDLCKRAASTMEDSAPDDLWLEQYYGLTGEHMILTEHGWEDGSMKAEYATSLDYADADYIRMEINAPREDTK